MYRHSLTRLLAVLVLATVASALTAVPQLGRATPVSAATTTTISICGPITAYLPATSLTSGEIIIAGTPYVIAPGAAVAGPSIGYGTSACLTATLDAAGRIIAGTLTSNVATNVNVCGTLVGFTPPTAFTPGALTIDGQSFIIAPNNSLGFVGTVSTGSQYCLSGTIDVTGRLVGGTLTPTAVSNFYVCGIVTSYIASTGVSLGTITIGGQTYAIVPGAVLTGGAFVVGSSVCLNGAVNGAGQITSGTFSGLIANPVPVSTFNTCGVLSLYVPATAGTYGSITLNGASYVLVPGTVVIGGGNGLTGGTFCLSATVNAAGQLVAATLSAVQLGPLSLCGVITAYAAPTATAAGSITVAGQTYAIAPGVTISGAPQLAVNANPTLCLQATLNLAGQISSGSLSTASNGTPTVSVCGAVTVYTAATATAAGTITVGGNTFPIAAGTTFVGVAQPAVGTSVCLTLVVNTAGVIVGATVVTSSTGVPLSATIVEATAGSRALARPQ